MKFKKLLWASLRYFYFVVKLGQGIEIEKNQLSRNIFDFLLAKR